MGQQSGKHVFGTAKIGEKGQIVIPKEARELFGIKPGDSLLILGDEDAGLIISKPDAVNEAAFKIFKKFDKNNK
ncbi:MAG: AbrB/MazE/SpoVT family DNA-binding domain-containing protein [Ruminococcaceae bacterium]|nr:AbrB/MazE/SpoVT family DNA-binding domain-containing protein [Oscillospiraceae bacterium]